MSLLFSDKLEKGIVAVWKIEESSSWFLSQLNLPDTDLKKVSEFKLETRKQEFLAVRVLIHELLNINPEIKYLASGKPVLVNSNYNLSISHTKGYAAIVLSEDIKAGVDIEIPSDRILKVSSRFVSVKEDDFIPEESRLYYYTLLWSLKEAMYKIYDQKNIIFNRHLEAKAFVLKEDGCIEGIYSKDYEECLNYTYKIAEDFCLVYKF